MTRILAALVLALTLGLAALGLLYRNAVQSAAAQKVQLGIATAALDKAEKQRKLDSATLVARAKLNASQGRKLVEAQGALQKALSAVPVWSEAIVPPEVQRALLRDSERSQNAPD